MTGAWRGDSRRNVNKQDFPEHSIITCSYGPGLCGGAASSINLGGNCDYLVTRVWREYWMCTRT
jgi:hypothetical protein